MRVFSQKDYNHSEASWKPIVIVTMTTSQLLYVISHTVSLPVNRYSLSNNGRTCNEVMTSNFCNQLDQKKNLHL